MSAHKLPELHDQTTGLPGPALLMDRLEHALARARRPRSRMAVLVVGLECISHAPDGAGGPLEEALLGELAPRLLDELRPGDTVARLRSDALVILCEALSDEAGAVSVAERILAAVNAPGPARGSAHLIIASIGIAIVEGDDARPLELLGDAEAAMQRARSLGGNRYELHDSHMRQRLLARFEAEHELRNAIDDGQMRLHYQPLVSLEDGHLIGAEALVRWQHPDRGLLLPGEFIPLAEETSAILALGKWVIERAFRDSAVWQASFPELMLSVSLNLSPRQVAQAGIPRVVREALRRSGAKPEQIQLELTESALIDGGATPAETLAALKELGLQLVLDDFGTGYSSLTYLKRFPIDAIKIDRSFISGLGCRREDTAIVAGVLTMARGLGIAVVAEGVENEFQAENLRALGCSYAQGYHFSRPVPAEVFAEYLVAAAEHTSPSRACAAGG